MQAGQPTLFHRIIIAADGGADRAFWPGRFFEKPFRTTLVSIDARRGRQERLRSFRPSRLAHPERE